MGRVLSLSTVILQPFPDADLYLGVFLKGIELHNRTSEAAKDGYPVALAVNADLDFRIAQ